MVWCSGSCALASHQQEGSSDLSSEKSFPLLQHLQAFAFVNWARQSMWRCLQALHRHESAVAAWPSVICPLCLYAQQDSGNVHKSTYDLWLCWIVCDCRVPEECPQEVADVIASCLDENPTNRPTARQIVDQLGALRETKGSHWVTVSVHVIVEAYTWVMNC